MSMKQENEKKQKKKQNKPTEWEKKKTANST